jgi:hypothetical protein
MVSLRMQGNQVLGYLNVGPGCFVTVGNPPTKTGRTLAQRKAGGRTLTLNIPNTQPVEAATQAIPQGSR